VTSIRVLFLTAALTVALPLGPATVVGSGVDGARSVVAADIDGDGDLDAVAASQDDGRVRWFENTAGNATAWTAHQIATRNAASWAVTADVDRDGDSDVIASSWGDNRIAWHENTAGNGSAWTEHAISTATQRPECVYAVDIDGDGDVDVLSASTTDDRVAWHDNTAVDGSAWTMRTIATNANGAWFVTASDVDGDGDPDAISGDLVGNKVAWYENPGSVSGAWTERSVSTANDDVRSVHGADIDGDSDIDIVAVGSANNRVAWYENASAGTSWTEHVVSTALGAAHSAIATDLDGDNDLDIVAAGFSDNSVVWFENAAGNGSAWTLTTVSTTVVAASSVFAADADGDGDRDVFATAWDGDAVYWFDNQGLAQTPTPQPCPDCPLLNWLVWLLLLIIALLIWFCLRKPHR
jgi:hypothetical protein